MSSLKCLYLGITVLQTGMLAPGRPDAASIRTQLPRLTHAAPSPHAHLAPKAASVRTELPCLRPTHASPSPTPISLRSSLYCHNEMEGREGRGGRGASREEGVRSERKPCGRPLSFSHRRHCSMCDTKSTFETSK